jgi:serpin B
MDDAVLHRSSNVLFRSSVLLCMILAVAAGCGDPVELTEAAVAAASDGNAFAFDLYGRLRTGQSANLFFSPQSIPTALAMIYAGARGETATEIARTLHFSLPQEQVPPAYAQLLAALERAGGTRRVRLAIANRLWGQCGTPFLQSFLTPTRKYFDAELGLVDFVHDAEAARGTINGWVGKETAGKITGLIPPGVLGANTQLVLTNAIYFRGMWARQFTKDATYEQFFYVSPDRTVSVPLMSETMKVGMPPTPKPGSRSSSCRTRATCSPCSCCCRTPPTACLRSRRNSRPRPSAGGRAALTVTRSGSTCPASPSRRASRSPRRSAPWGPLAFSDRADFSGMNGRRDLLLSAALHEARVDVDEEGTEAAAVATGWIRVQAAPPQPLTFRADHPFVFLIRHNPTGAILFFGRVVDPKA